MISLGLKIFSCLFIPYRARRLIAPISLLELECSSSAAAAADVHELEPGEAVGHLGLTVVAGPELREWEEREKAMSFRI